MKGFLKMGTNREFQKMLGFYLVAEKLLPSLEEKLLSFMVDVCYLLISPLQVSKLPVL
jgi:hypothetical protein